VTTTDLDDLLSIDEAAALLKVTTSAVRSWLSKKRLPRIKAGRRTLISRQSLVAFLTASQSEAAAHE
jgi:excisionase family DNA binding protein